MPNDAARERAHSEPGSTRPSRRPFLILGLVVGVVLLDQITKALPPYTWLTGIAVAGGGNVAPGTPGSQALGPGTTDSTGRTQVRVWITGSTVDIQAFTTFLRQLAASPWLTDVMPATTSTIIEADRPVTAFNVAVRFRVADSVYIRTVPLTQSAR